ncbi:MAG TPA: hypothetical protein GXX53_04045 [Tissierellia bacterium]|nr:hypothetical protein [Tissierellia bacterium]
MFTNDIIDRKIVALLDYIGESLDETINDDLVLYSEIRDFAEKNGGLLYNIYDETYLIINFIGEDGFHIIPVVNEYST